MKRRRQKQSQMCVCTSDRVTVGRNKTVQELRERAYRAVIAGQGWRASEEGLCGHSLLRLQRFFVEARAQSGVCLPAAAAAELTVMCPMSVRSSTSLARGRDRAFLSLSRPSRTVALSTRQKVTACYCGIDSICGAA